MQNRPGQHPTVHYGAIDPARPLLTREGSAVVSTRLTHDVRASLQTFAKTAGVTQALIIRRVLALALTAPDKDGSTLAAVTELLGLPKDASRAEIIQALDELIGSSEGDGLSGTADPPPADALARKRPAPAPAPHAPSSSVVLSAHELATAAKIPSGPKRTQFLAMRTASLTKSNAEKLRRARDRK